MKNDIQARYEQAQTLMQGMLSKELTLNDAVFPHWIDDSDCFWYLRDTKDGKEFRRVDAAKAENLSAFDHDALAKALSSASGQTVDARDLPITELTFILQPLQIQFSAFGKRWLFDSENTTCNEIEVPPQIEGLCSPDGKKAVFVRDHNLWVRDRITGKENALTEDGSAEYYYGGAPLAADVQALWSPDSRHVLTHQLDLREVTTRHLVHHVPQDGTIRPQLTDYKMAYPGDKQVAGYRLISINIETGEVQAADYRRLPFYDIGVGFFTDEKLAWWADDNQRAFFVDVERGAKTVRVVELNTQTGATRVLIDETSETFVKLKHNLLESIVFVPLPDSEELIWFSERSGWAHLYLYDMQSGELKHRLTGGESSDDSRGQWIVRNIIEVDKESREVILQTAGRDKNISPYYRDICRVNLDTGELSPWVEGNFEHFVYCPADRDRQVATRAAFGSDSGDVNGLSACGNYLVTTQSRVDTAPVSLLIDREGKTLLTLETTDVSNLPSDWQWPEPVTVKGADGETDLYGVIYRPPGFSADQSYPVLDYSCGHPGFTFVPQGSFFNGPCFDLPYLSGAAYAALGFVVVALEGRGTPYRSKAFHDESYGNMANANNFTDRISGLKQLAKKYAYMDVDRVGLVGCDGITGTVRGLLEHPDFYKVGIAMCLSDARFGYAAIAEQFDGLLAHQNSSADAAYRYGEDHVQALKGKLLLIQGMLDTDASTTGTFRLIDALQQANKDFDMILLPTEGHDMPTYALRRSWDYLVEHLLNTQPPSAFPLTTGLDLAIAEIS